MKHIDPTFEWLRCPDGYACEDRGSGAHEASRLARIPATHRSAIRQIAVVVRPVSNRSETYRPFSMSTPAKRHDLMIAIHEHYKRLEAFKGAEDIRRKILIEFSERWGSLRVVRDTRGHLQEAPFDLRDWMMDTQSLFTAMDIWRAATADESLRDTKLRAVAKAANRALGFRDPPIPYLDFLAKPLRARAFDAIAHLSNHSFGGVGDEDYGAIGLRTEIEHTKAGMKIHAFIRPGNLLAAAWLQLRDAMYREARCKDCEVCGDGFIVGTDGDYENRQYCGNTCKQRKWRRG